MAQAKVLNSSSELDKLRICNRYLKTKPLKTSQRARPLIPLFLNGELLLRCPDSGIFVELPQKLKKQL